MIRPSARQGWAARAGVGALAATLAATLPGVVAHAEGASPPPAASSIAPQLEHLDRGLVAAQTDDGVYLSWRLLAEETTGAGENGMEGPDFAVYRDDVRIATVSGSTNLLDADGVSGASYRVVPVVNGVELASSDAVEPWNGASASLPLQKPADGVTPAGEAYTYSANDMSVGDMDGDGDLEYVVKWYPSNAKDVSQVGYTGNTYLDTYEADGTLLHRIDLGVNIRSGAHYTQFMVYDFDGDGRAEIMTKTAPGTSVTADGETDYVTIAADDAAAGVTDQDDYRMSAEDYRLHLVDVFRGWSSRDEVVSGQWPASLEEAFGISPQYDYPLSEADAAALVDHFIDVYAPSRSARNQLRSFEGFVLTGPEYLTVFDGETGAELETVDYKPGRDDDGLLWGDYAMARIEPGNRNDRFLAGVAYLDGAHPSAVFARGYYTRSTLVAYDWDGEHLAERWFVDSGHAPMDNPFNDSPHGVDGTDPEFGTLTTQGFHSLSAADVDGDGRQEVVYGSATIDDDGSLLYSSFAEMPEGSAAPGTSARLGHGDAMHVTDILPDREGLEIFTVHEGGTSAPYGWALRDAATGEVLAGEYSGKDTGRGMVGDIDPDSPGLEYWASMPPGSAGSIEGLGTNQSIRWAADGTTQIVQGYGDEEVSIVDGAGAVLLQAEGSRSNNGTKGNPSLVADVFGDWREELLVRSADSTEIRIYLSTEVTDRALTTLLHDPQYRAEVARQNTTYNQPSYTSYRLASDTDFADVPVYTTVVSAPAPTAVDKPGKGSDGYVVPDADGVDYYVDGELVAPGFHRAKDGVAITAVPRAWYALTGDASWELTLRTGR
ncbi:rhamnogalacturonan lyase [Microbacterium gilvum]|uniref:Rhamnogalacturonan I lyase beta-sheet domain-containing protein n=1 Tax=Microbacterium gilvum TaxID=1336204 RepID=A0ABP8ZXD1_9MICO